MKKHLLKISAMVLAFVLVFTTVPLTGRLNAYADAKPVVLYDAGDAGNTPYYYESVSAALSKMEDKHNYRIVLEDNLTDTVAISNALVVSVELDLNGFALTGSSDNPVITVPVKCLVSICDGSEGKTGTITRAKTSVSENGGGIYNEGIVVFSGGTISGCSAGYGGGICNKGSLFLSGGEISGCSAQWTGGGIYNGGTVTFSGGEISGCSAQYGGGGILNCDGAELNMKGGEISGCSATETGTGYGGGISNAGEVVIGGGGISGCTAPFGGGIYNVNVNTYKFRMDAGNIDSCTAEYGGGIFVPYLGCEEASISGGSVTGCSAQYGGGIFVNNSINLSGNPDISGNTANGAANNIFLFMDSEDEAFITIAAPLNTEAALGITCGKCPSEDAPVVFTKKGSSYSLDDLYSPASHFVSDSSAYEITESADGEAILAVAKPVPVSYGDSSVNVNMSQTTKMTGTVSGGTVNITDNASNLKALKNELEDSSSDSLLLDISGVKSADGVKMEGKILDEFTDSGKSLTVVNDKSALTMSSKDVKLGAGETNSLTVKLTPINISKEEVPEGSGLEEPKLATGVNIKVTDGKGNELSSLADPAMVSLYTESSVPVGCLIAHKTAGGKIEYLPNTAIFKVPARYSAPEENIWFRFDENGQMLSGWQWIPDANGVMHCYYINPTGLLNESNYSGSIPGWHGARFYSYTDSFSPFILMYDAAALEKAAEGVTGCGRDESCVLDRFTDCINDSWYHDGVHFCLDAGLMNGVSGTLFSPSGTTSRAMAVTMLWRMAGSPLVSADADFNDVSEGSWYFNAVRWAASEGIVNGYGNGCFGPDDPVTREQLANIIYGYAKTKGKGFTGAWMFLLDFSDRAEVSSWADEAVHWCVMNGILEGNENGMLIPKGNASRAAAATMFMRFCEGEM